MIKLMDLLNESTITERQFKGLDGIDAKTPLTKISDAQKLKIIQSTGNIISFFVPKGVTRNFWQVISTGKIKKGKSLSGDVVYTLPGKMIGSPQFKSEKDLIDGVDWESVEKARRFNESVIDEAVDKADLKNAKFRLKKVLKYLDIEYKETRGGKKYVQINYIPVTTPQWYGPEFVNVRYEDENDLQNIGKALKLKLKESVNEAKKPIIIKYDNRKLSITSDDLKRLKSGKDVVGKSLTHAGQEEWISSKRKWSIDEDSNLIESVVNEESFVAKSTKSGKVVNFGSKETRDSAIKSGEYEEPEKGDTTDGEATPKVNIFDKPKGDTPTTDNPKPTKEPAEKTDYEKGKVKNAKEAVGRISTKIKGWAKEEKEFFKSDSQKGGSEERRSWGKAISDKAKGALQAIKKGVKHEVEEFKTAGGAVKSLFKGEPMDENQKKALKAVAIKVVTTALFGAVTGGAAHGAAAFGKHVALEFIPHVVGETILKGVGKASLFAGEDEENEDVIMEKFVKMIAEKIANEPIPAELMEKFVDSYNEKNN